MSNENNIYVKVYDPQKIKLQINDPGNIKIKLDTGVKGDKGETGPAGTTDHALLTNLTYANSGHAGFQKSLADLYIAAYKAFVIN
jgi:hypothetical protein